MVCLTLALAFGSLGQLLDLSLMLLPLLVELQSFFALGEGEKMRRMIAIKRSKIHYQCN
jgi:hypothetical protein